VGLQRWVQPVLGAFQARGAFAFDLCSGQVQLGGDAVVDVDVLDQGEELIEFVVPVAGIPLVCPGWIVLAEMPIEMAADLVAAFDGIVEVGDLHR